MSKEAATIPPYNVNSTPIFDSKQILTMLPHRYPFQLVDKIIQLDEQSITGIKNVTSNEPFFPGHFPGNPVMPGVLQVEALIQTGGMFLLNTVSDPENYQPYFLGIDACRFRKLVLPGDTLRLHCQLLVPIKTSTSETQERKIGKVQGKAFVGNQLVCEATMLAQMVKQK